MLANAYKKEILCVNKSTNEIWSSDVVVPKDRRNSYRGDMQESLNDGSALMPTMLHHGCVHWQPCSFDGPRR